MDHVLLPLPAGAHRLLRQLGRAYNRYRQAVNDASVNMVDLEGACSMEALPERN